MNPTFRDLIAENKRNSALLVLIFCLFTAAVALILALGIVALLDPKAVAQLRWGEALWAGGIAAVLAFFVAGLL
jgi:hypothetical protein